jgi:hypothetical protein
LQLDLSGRARPALLFVLGRLMASSSGLKSWLTPEDCEIAKWGPKKFFCGRKKKFGLYMQATCDAEGRFLDVSIKHPAATSDHLAFCTSSFRHKLERQGFLAPKLCLFGDNAYINMSYMVTPFKGIASGTKDNCTFIIARYELHVMEQYLSIGLF